MSPEPWRHETVLTNGIHLHCVTAGEGPLVLLLHGFPECWYSWRHQIPFLAAAGYRVAAPDLRGYNRSDRPASGYDVETLSEDVLGLLDHYGNGKAILAGHDWGGAIAWNVALRWPDRLSLLVALNIPHPTLLARALLTNPRQMLRSWYILFFQIPGLPEWLFRQRDYAAIEQAFRGTAAHPERFTDRDIQVYKDAARQPGALTAMLAYYRSLRPSWLLRAARGAEEMMVRVPTRMIWGERDHALGKELTFGTERFAPDFRIRYLPGAAHWVQQEQPEEGNRILAEFLAAARHGR